MISADISIQQILGRVPTGAKHCLGSWDTSVDSSASGAYAVVGGMQCMISKLYLVQAEVRAPWPVGYDFNQA